MGIKKSPFFAGVYTSRPQDRKSTNMKHIGVNLVIFYKIHTNHDISYSPELT